MIRKLAMAAAICVSSGTAASAQGLPPLSGVWDCVVNGYHGNIQIRMQLAPNGTLVAQGWMMLNQTTAQGNFTGTGRHGQAGPEPGAPDWRYAFQIRRQDGFIFSLYAGPTENPNWLYNRFTNPSTGAQSETSCNRVG